MRVVLFVFLVVFFFCVCADKTILYPDCDYLNLHMWSHFIEIQTGECFNSIVSVNFLVLTTALFMSDKGS